MNKSILQIPISPDLKDKAEKIALSYGFSSLQEFVSLVITQISQSKIRVKVVPSKDKETHLSKKAEKIYIQMLKDYKKGIKWYQADNVEDFLYQLNES